jgi:hypothetical protein
MGTVKHGKLEALHTSRPPELRTKKRTCMSAMREIQSVITVRVFENEFRS